MMAQELAACENFFWQTDLQRRVICRMKFAKRGRKNAISICLRPRIED